MKSHFFAYLSRMKLIRRWSLMRNTFPENIQEHSYQVALITHGLALIGTRHFGRNYNVPQLVITALYHDVGEVIAGDLPTPVKYFNPEMKKAYAVVENSAKNRLLGLLPADLQEDYREYFFYPTSGEYRLIKAADKIAAYLKCLEETAAQNNEFTQAQISLKEQIESFADLPEVAYFMESFAGSFALTLDEMSMENG